MSDSALSIVFLMMLSACSAPDGTLIAAPPSLVTLTSIEPGSLANTSHIQLAGSANPMTTIEIFASDHCDGAPVAQAQTDASGLFKVALDAPLNAVTPFTAMVLNASSATPCSLTVITFTEDSNAPPAPQFEAMPTPSANDHPAIQGAAEAGSWVQIFANGQCQGDAAQSVVADASSKFSINVQVTDNSTTEFSANSVDPAGNVSFCSTVPLAYTEDSIAPRPPLITRMLPSDYSSSLTPSLSGKTEPFATVQFYKDSSCSEAPLGVGSADNSGRFQISLSVTANSRTQLYTVVTDLAQNHSACSDSGYAYTCDTASPREPHLTGADATTAGGLDAPLILGTSSAYTLVSLYTQSDCTGSVAGWSLSNGSGHFGVQVRVDAGSVTTFYGQASNPDGLYSPCSAVGLAYGSERN